MTNLVCRFCVFVFLLFHLSCALASDKTFRWQKQSFPQYISSYVLAFVQSQQGFYWLGGTAGLIRYDGKVFEPVNFYDENGAQLAVSPTVLSIAEGRNNHLWIGTTAGLYLYQPEVLRANVVKSVLKTPIKRLFYSEGWLFGLSYSHGAFSFDGAQLTQYAEGVSSTHYSDMAVDGRYFYLLSKHGELTVYARDGGVLVKSLDLGNERLSRLHLMGEKVWLSGKSADFVQVDVKSWQTIAHHIGEFSVVDVTTLDDGRLLLVDSEDQFYLFNVTGITLTKSGKFSDQGGRPASVDIRKLAVMPSGELWVTGNKPNELYRQDSFAGAFRLSEFAQSTPQTINDIRFSEQGELYSATSAGLFRQQGFDTEHQKLQSGHFTEITALIDQDIFLLDESGVLQRFDTLNGRLTPLKDSSCDNLLTKPVYIDKLNDGRLILFDGKVGAVTIADGKCRLATPDYKVTPGIKGVSIYDVHKLAEGHYLVSTTWGIFQYRLPWTQMKSWQVENLQASSNMKPILQFGQAWGGVLMPEHGGKLMAYFPDKEDFRIIRFAPLAGDHIVRLNTLHGPGLVIGSERGIYLHTPQYNRFWSLTALLQNKPLKKNQLALGNDQLALVVDNRIFRLPISYLKDAPGKLPKAYINTLSINQQVQQPGADNPYLPQNFGYHQQLTLGHLDAFVSFEVSAIGDYVAPYEIQYRLLGLSEQWISLQSNDRIGFTSLPPGKYQLEIRTSNRLGLVSDEVTRLDIRVRPAPWRSWQAIVLYIVFIVLLIVTLFYRQKKRHSQQQLLLENTVEERTESLNAAVADLKQQSEQISQLLTQKEALIDEKDTMLAAISHELKTPLSTLEAPLALLADGKSTIRELLPVMQRSTDRIKRFIDQILLLAKLGEQKSVEKQWLPFDALVGYVASAYRDFAQRHQVELICDIEHNVELQGGVQTLEILLGNLLSNAIVHGKSGKLVSLKLHLQGGDAVVTVVDKGRGMNDEDKALLFKPFASGGEGGSGLGMALSEQIVAAHGGRIKVDSAPGKGCRFEIYLPQGRRSEQPQEYDGGELAVPTVESMDNAIAHEGKTKLLIVDDEGDIQVLLRVVLAPYFQLLFAHDGEQAKTVLQQEQVALVLCDQYMPNMKGTELTDWIKQNNTTSHIPVIVMSADAESHTRQSALEHMADAFFSKPFDYKVLLAQINSLLQNRARISAAQLVTSSSEQAVDDGLNTTDKRFMGSLHELMEQHYTDPEFKLSDQLAFFAMSERNLRYKINALTGESPSNYLYQFRLEKAKLMLESDLTIEEISNQNGFKNVRQFRKRFIEYIGLSPSEMRNQLT